MEQENKLKYHENISEILDDLEENAKYIYENTEDENIYEHLENIRTGYFKLYNYIGNK